MGLFFAPLPRAEAAFELELYQGEFRSIFQPQGDRERLGKPARLEEVAGLLKGALQNLAVRQGKELFYNGLANNSATTYFFKGGIFPTDLKERDQVPVERFIEIFYNLGRWIEQANFLDVFSMGGGAEGPHGKSRATSLHQKFTELGIFEVAFFENLIRPVTRGEVVVYLARFTEKIATALSTKGYPRFSYGDLPPEHPLYLAFAIFEKYELTQKLPKEFLFQENRDSAKFECYYFLGEIARQFTLSPVADRNLTFRNFDSEHWAYNGLNFLQNQGIIQGRNLKPEEAITASELLNLGLWAAVKVRKFKGDRIHEPSLNGGYGLDTLFFLHQMVGIDLPFKSEYFSANSLMSRGDAFFYISALLKGIEKFFATRAPVLLNEQERDSFNLLVDQRETPPPPNPVEKSHHIRTLVGDLKDKIREESKVAREKAERPLPSLLEIEQGKGVPTIDESTYYLTPEQKIGLNLMPPEGESDVGGPPIAQLVPAPQPLPPTTPEIPVQKGIVSPSTTAGAPSLEKGKSDQQLGIEPAVNTGVKTKEREWMDFLSDHEKKVNRLRAMEYLVDGSPADFAIKEQRKKYREEGELIEKATQKPATIKRKTKDKYRPKGMFFKSSHYGPTGLSLTPSNRTLQAGRIRVFGGMREPKELSNPRYQILEAGVIFAGQNVEGGVTQRSSNRIDLELPSYFVHTKVKLGNRFAVGGLLDASQKRGTEKYKESVYGVYAIGSYVTVGGGVNIGERTENSLLGEKQPFFKRNYQNYFGMAGVRLPLARWGQVSLDTDFQSVASNLSFYILEDKVIIDLDWYEGPQYPNYLAREGQFLGRVNFLFY